MVFIILLQKGKSSMGLGSMGGGTQLLFGGSGGQDLFQKATWIMGAIFMGGSLILAMMRRPTESELIASLAKQQSKAAQTAPKVPTQ
jgi:protein translocase SecG subunit